MNAKAKQCLKTIPSVSALLECDTVAAWLEQTPHSVVVAALRVAVEEARRRIVAGEQNNAVDIDALLLEAQEAIEIAAKPSLARVINATGVVLHTGLGRAPLCEAAIDAMALGASGYCNLEYDLETGRRGRRMDHVRRKLAALTGAEAAIVVNNNAAATLLILRTFAAGREAIVSRGQLIEIGGSFRLPDIMSASGAVLREVGTTNRTRLSDYALAISERTAMLVRVHTSNYRVVGFTEEVPMGQIAALARERDLISLDDLGSGVLLDHTRLGGSGEPTVAASIAAGSDLVCFSGDKLLGGPQSGIIAGRKDLICEIESSPLMRTYRPGKLTLLALEATLDQYHDAENARANIPVLSMLAVETDELARRAQRLCDSLIHALPEEDFLVCSSVGYAGGGSMPQQALESVAIRWRPATGSAGQVVQRLREGEPPVIAMVRDDAVCLDLRTIEPEDIKVVRRAIEQAVGHA